MIKQPKVRIKLDPIRVMEIFGTKKTQGEVLEALYRLVFPNMDAIVKVDDWPHCNRKTWVEIATLFRKFDTDLNKTRPFDKQVFIGGAWLNNGFSCHNIPSDLKDWEVIPCVITLKT